MAITVAPGQVVSSGDWDALFKQHGGMPNNQQAILRPPTKQEQDAAFAAETDDFDQRPIYRYTLADGSYVDARTSKDGAGWEVIEYKPSAKFTASNPNTTSAQQKPPGGREGPEGTPDPSKPGGFDNDRPIWVVRDKDGNAVWSGPLTQQQREQWERDRNESAGRGRKTDAELAAANEQATDERQVATHPGWVQVTRKKGNDTKIVYRDPQGVEHATLPEKPAEAKTELVTINGQRYQVRRTPGTAGQPDKIEWFDPSGKPLAAPPVEVGKPHTEVVTVNGRRYTTTVTTLPEGGVKIENFGPDGKPIAEIPQSGAVNLPADFPRYTPDLTKRGQGLIEYQQAVDQWMAANPNHPFATWDNRQKVLSEAIGTAQVITGEFNVAAGILREAYQGAYTQRSQDITQAGNRLTAANTQVQQALSTIEKLGPYLGAAPGDAGRLFLGLQAAQMAHGTLMGGMRESPRVEMDPRMGAFADRTLGPAPTDGAPVPGAPAAPAQPGQAAPAPAAPPVSLATVDPARAEMIRRTPVFRPQPPVGGDPMTNLPQGPSAAGNIGAGEWFTPTGPQQASPSDQILDPGRPIGQFDGVPGTGPGANLGPPPALPAPAPAGQPDALGRLSLLPETPSWHEQAQQQAFKMEPIPAPTGPYAFNRPLPATFSPGGGGLGFGQFTLPQVPTQIQGLSPDIDEQARREVMAEMGAA